MIFGAMRLKMDTIYYKTKTSRDMNGVSGGTTKFVLDCLNMGIWNRVVT